MNPLYTFSGAKTSELDKRIKGALEVVSKRPAEALFNIRPPQMSRLRYLRFRILHHQFTGRYTPGLPTAVRTGRILMKRLKGLGKRPS